VHRTTQKEQLAKAFNGAVHIPAHEHPLVGVVVREGSRPGQQLAFDALWLYVCMRVKECVCEYVCAFVCVSSMCLPGAQNVREHSRVGVMVREGQGRAEEITHMHVHMHVHKCTHAFTHNNTAACTCTCTHSPTYTHNTHCCMLISVDVSQLCTKRKREGFDQ
jgi:hypothetical protein